MGIDRLYILYNYQHQGIEVQPKKRIPLKKEEGVAGRMAVSIRNGLEEEGSGDGARRPGLLTLAVQKRAS